MTRFRIDVSGYLEVDANDVEAAKDKAYEFLGLFDLDHELKLDVKTHTESDTKPASLLLALLKQD